MSKNRFQPLLDRLAGVERRVSGVDRTRWCVVDSVSPLRIREDTPDATLLLGKPDTLVADLRVGDRVLVMRRFRRDVILGRGQGGLRRFASKAALDLWMPADGAHAWVASESAQYVRSGGVWRLSFGDTGWVDVPYQTGFTPQAGFPAQVRKDRGVVFMRGSVNLAGHSFAVSHTFGVAPAGFRPVGQAEVFPVAVSSAAVNAYVQVAANGDLLLRADADTSGVLYLSGVRYLT